MHLGKFQSGAAGSPPSAPVSPSAGYPTDGDPVAPVPATIPGEYWFYQLMTELNGVITGAGLTPDHTNLTQLAAAIASYAQVLPLNALAYPTVFTSNNQITVTGSTDAAGGKVAIPASVDLALGVEVVSGHTGRVKSFITAAWTSPSLSVSSTYYLRATVVAGVLTPYVQKGTDSDSIPGGLVGTVNGSSGGGFDSTVLDILLAKVVTGLAGSSPTITQLANAARLMQEGSLNDTANSNASANRSWTATHTLNWARTPKTICAHSYQNNTDAACANQVYDTVTTSRYKVDHAITISLEPSATVSITLFSRALAVA